MADIKLSIINMALTAAGEDPLTVLAPGAPMPNAAIENYDAIVGEELENGTWKFATKVANLSLLTALSDKPLQYRWQLPAEARDAVQDILHCGKELDGGCFDIEADVVRTSYNSRISARYTFRPDEAKWPMRFRNIISGRLEALFLRVSERHSEATTMDKATEYRKTIARHTDARQRSNRKVAGGSLVDARMGRRNRRSS